MSGKPITNHERQIIRAARANGISWGKIQELLPERSIETLRYHASDVPPPPHGWPPRGRPRRLDCIQLARLDAAGVSRKELCERYGAGHTAIWQAVRRGRQMLEQAA